MIKVLFPNSETTASDRTASHTMPNSTKSISYNWRINCQTGVVDPEEQIDTVCKATEVACILVSKLMGKSQLRQAKTCVLFLGYVSVSGSELTDWVGVG